MNHSIIILLFILLSGQAWSQKSSEKLSTPDIDVLWRNEFFGSINASKELTGKRDAFAKHFENEDGSITAHIAAGPIHYYENNQWKTIFHTISPTSNGFENIHNSFKTYYPATSTGNIETILQDGSAWKDMLNMRMYYDVNGQITQLQNIQSAAGNADFNKLSYSNVYGTGIDLRLTQNTTQRKMDYIIQSQSALGNIPVGATSLIFEESAQLPEGWTAVLKDNAIYLMDMTGKVQVKYEKPLFTDTPEENMPEGKSPFMAGTYELIQNGNQVVIKTKVPLVWLMSSERTFPVIIDPTANFSPDNVLYYDGRVITDNCALTGTANLNAGEWLYEGVFQDGTPYFTQSVWSQFNTSSICDASTISSVVLKTTVASRSGMIDVKYRKLTTAPYTASNATRLSEIRGGSEYNDIARAATGNFNSTGTKTHTLGGTAAADLQANLASDWFGVGYHLYGAQTCASYAVYNRHDHASKIVITVTYTVPALSATLTTPSATLLCSGGTVTLGGSVTATGSWTITLSTGATVTGSGSGTWSTTVTTSATTTYSISSITGGCPGTASGSTIITLVTPNGSLSNNNESATCAVSGNQWVHFYHSSGRYLASVHPNNQNLGNVTMTSYVTTPQVMNACSAPTNPLYSTVYMGRTWVMNSSSYPNGNNFPSTVNVKLPFKNSELSDLNTSANTATPGNPNDGGTIPATLANLMLTKITSATTENGTANAADCSAGTIRAITASTGNGATPQSVSGASYKDFTIQQFSEFFLHKNHSNSALPVNLTSFSATCNDEGQVDLRWSTASEQNSEKFIIEKSRDLDHWIEVGTKDATGNSNYEIHYNSTDENPWNGISYYRLVQTDIDGQQKQYGPVSVQCDPQGNSMTIFPNPSNSLFSVEIQFSKDFNDAVLEVTDLSGKLVCMRKVNLFEGTNQFLFDGLEWSSGSYIVRLVSGATLLNPVKVMLIRN